MFSENTLMLLFIWTFTYPIHLALFKTRFNQITQKCIFFLLSDATVYVGGLDEKVSEPLLWELFLQAGPVVNTHMPKDRVTGQHQGEHQLINTQEE